MCHFAKYHQRMDKQWQRYTNFHYSRWHASTVLLFLKFRNVIGLWGLVVRDASLYQTSQKLLKWLPRYNWFLLFQVAAVHYLGF